MVQQGSLMVGGKLEELSVADFSRSPGSSAGRLMYVKEHGHLKVFLETYLLNYAISIFKAY